jgi:hypothetical protein
MDGSCIGVTSRHLPAMHVCLRARRFDRLVDDMITVARVYRPVAIAVKDNGRHN